MSIETPKPSLDTVEITSQKKKIDKLVQDTTIELREKRRKIEEFENQTKTALKKLDTTQESEVKTAWIKHAAYLKEVKQEIEN